jgi:chemotaxis protein MotB
MILDEGGGRMNKRLVFLLVFLPLFFLTNCAELTELRRIKVMQDERIAELEKQNNEYKDSYFKLKSNSEKERIKSSAEIENLKSELKVYEQSRTEKENRLSDENASLRRNVNALTNELKASGEELKRQKEESSAKISELGSTLGGKENELKKSQDEKTAIFAEMESLKSRLSSMDSEISEKKTEAQTLQGQISQKDAAIVTLESKVADLESKLKKAQAASDEHVKTLKAQIEALKKTGPEKVNTSTSKAVLENIESEVKVGLAAEISSGKLQVVSTERAVVLRLASDDLFDPASVILSQNVQPLLSKIANLLKQFPDCMILVEGHTDNIPIQNLPFVDNLALSSARADAVVRYLMEASKIESKRLKSVSCSWFHPIVSNDAPEGRKQNRRVDIVIDVSGEK